MSCDKYNRLYRRENGNNHVKRIETQVNVYSFNPVKCNLTENVKKKQKTTKPKGPVNFSSLFLYVEFVSHLISWDHNDEDSGLSDRCVKIDSKQSEVLVLFVTIIMKYEIVACKSMAINKYHDMCNIQ